MSDRVSTRPANANKHPGAIEATEKRKRRTKEEIERDKALQWAKKAELQRQKEKAMKDIADLEAKIAAQDDKVTQARRDDRKRRSEALAGTQQKGLDTVDMGKDHDLPGTVDDCNDGLTDIVDDPERPVKKLKQLKAPVDGTTGSTYNEPAPGAMRMQDKVRCFGYLLNHTC
jgi:hypothetical protein